MRLKYFQFVFHGELTQEYVIFFAPLVHGGATVDLSQEQARRHMHGTVTGKRSYVTENMKPTMSRK